MVPPFPWWKAFSPIGSYAGRSPNTGWCRRVAESNLIIQAPQIHSCRQTTMRHFEPMRHLQDPSSVLSNTFSTSPDSQAVQAFPSATWWFDRFRQGESIDNRWTQSGCSQSSALFPRSRRAFTGSRFAALPAKKCMVAVHHPEYTLSHKMILNPPRCTWVFLCNPWERGYSADWLPPPHKVLL